MDEQELLELKDKIDRAKNEVNRLTGRKESLMETLEKDWNCTNLNQAEKQLETLEKEAETLRNKIDTGLKELQTEYEKIEKLKSE